MASVEQCDRCGVVDKAALDRSLPDGWVDLTAVVEEERRRDRGVLDEPVTSRLELCASCWGIIAKALQPLQRKRTPQAAPEPEPEPAPAATYAPYDDSNDPF